MKFMRESLRESNSKVVDLVKVTVKSMVKCLLDDDVYGLFLSFPARRPFCVFEL